MIDEIDLDTENGGLRLRAAINGALKSAITDHGPISEALMSSATKRILGAIKTFNRNQRARRMRDGSSVEARLDAIETRLSNAICARGGFCAREFGHEGDCKEEGEF